MDFQLKQWRDEQQQQQVHESEHEQQQPPSAKQPKLLFNNTAAAAANNPSPSCAALPLFVPEPTTNKLTTNLSAYQPDPTLSATDKYPRMGSYFSLAQWQELELQALIYRHMLAGAQIPTELLHCVKKSLITTSSPFHLPLQHYPYYQQSLVQSGYWGRGGMDPEPGRCRRTDGKKWRCSRDVVAGQKYCERHMHRGRNRSRKPVEIPTPTNNNSTDNNVGGNGVLLKTNINNNNPLVAQPISAVSATGGAATHHQFTLSSGSSHSNIDLINLRQRPSETIITNNGPFEAHNDVSGDGKSSGRTLRHFFDDWPRSLQETGNSGSNVSSVTSVTNLSISTPGNPSDFSLRLSTGDRESDNTDYHNGNRSNWVTPWGSNRAASLGGPLAEALQSSTSNSSPTSVLHPPARGTTTSEASYVST